MKHPFLPVNVNLLAGNTHIEVNKRTLLHPVARTVRLGLVLFLFFVRVCADFRDAQTRNLQTSVDPLRSYEICRAMAVVPLDPTGRYDVTICVICEFAGHGISSVISD